jgi:colicin import membrane protein
VADIALEKSKKEEQQRKLLEEAKNQKIQKEIEDKKAKELKLRKEKEAQEQRELAERLEKEKRAKTEREKAEREKLEKEKLAKAKAAEQAERDKQEKAEKARLEQQRKLQADKEHTAKAAQQADDKARKEERQRQIQQMMSQAGTHAASDTAGTRTGGANASRGGPSAGYAAKIRGAVLPNIIFTGTVSGNPSASVEVRLLSDGTIASAKIQKSSGVPAWDKAVLDALDRTNRFPKDEDGRVEPIIVIDFRPN